MTGLIGELIDGLMVVELIDGCCGICERDGDDGGIDGGDDEDCEGREGN